MKREFIKSALPASLTKPVTNGCSSVSEIKQNDPCLFAVICPIAKKRNLMKVAGVINFWDVRIFLTNERTRLKFCHSVGSAGTSKLIKIILYWNFKISKLS